jgi:CRISPR-associated protein Csx17
VLEEAILRYCRTGDSSRFGDVAAAVGALERAIAQSPRARASTSPLPGLSASWVDACGDDAAEVALAAALASCEPTLRPYLEPVRRHESRVRWADGSGMVVWERGALAKNLSRVLERLLLARAGAEREATVPRGTRAALASHVALFLRGSLDEGRIEDLLWTFCAVAEPIPARDAADDASSLPRNYALLKLLFLDDRGIAQIRGDDRSVGLEPDLALLRLAIADPSRAVAEAVRRLRAAGCPPLGETRRGQAPRLSFVDAIDGTRLAGALLLPISDARALGRLVLRQRPSLQGVTR